MAIQLARAIGEQRKPISPLEGLSDIIAKTGEGIQKKQEAEQAKTQREQAMKDAIANSVKVDSSMKAYEPDKKDYASRYSEILSELAVMKSKPETKASDIQSFVEKSQLELDQMKSKAESDYEANQELDKIKENYHVDYAQRLLDGWEAQEVEKDDPEAFAAYQTKKDEIENDRKRVIAEETEAAKAYNYDEETKNNVIKGLNDIYDEQLAKIESLKKTKKEIIPAHKGYFYIPLRERAKGVAGDLREVIDKTKVRKSVGVLPAMQDYQNNFKPESLVKIHKDNKGVVVATPDTEAIEKSRAKYILSMTSPISYGQKHDIEKSALSYSAMKLMEQENIPKEEKPKRFIEYVEKVAGDSFDRMVETTVAEQSRKTNEARLLKEGSGSGEKESKTKVVKIEGAVPPAVEGYRNKVISGFDQQIDDLKAKKEKYSRALNYAKEQNDEAAVKRNKMLAQTADENISKIEESKEKVKNQKFSTSDSYEFSSSEFRNDPNLALTDGSGSTTMNVSPTSIFKWGGKTYIGAVVTKGDETRDEYFPYNNTNKAKLSVNNTELVEEFDKKGFKTTEELDAEKQKKGSAKPATQKTWAEIQAEKKKNK